MKFKKTAALPSSEKAVVASESCVLFVSNSYFRDLWYVIVAARLDQQRARALVDPTIKYSLIRKGLRSAVLVALSKYRVLAHARVRRD
jgi:hypothetical protein